MRELQASVLAGTCQECLVTGPDPLVLACCLLPFAVASLPPTSAQLHIIPSRPTAVQMPQESAEHQNICTDALRWLHAPLKSITVGMERMPYSVATPGDSSVFSFRHTSFPACSLAMSSIRGAIMRQGPHQGAQKSTRTGSGLFSTCNKCSTWLLLYAL